MPRLRTTASLSLLALVVGTAGTGWLSAQTAVWRAVSPSMSTASVPAQPARVPRADWVAQPRKVRHHQTVAAVRTRRAGPTTAEDAMVSVGSPPPSPTLIPVSTPADDTPYERLRGHLDGSVILQVVVDGAGSVRQAAVARSSGDPILDTHALNVVDGWRFAVPPDYPDGFSGELPMRFDTGASLARTP